jgi:hypothetical protein
MRVSRGKLHGGLRRTLSHYPYWRALNFLTWSGSAGEFWPSSSYSCNIPRAARSNRSFFRGSNWSAIDLRCDVFYVEFLDKSP